MHITWYGQASFGITTADGLHIVTDPYDPKTSGFKDYPQPADVIVMSSDNDSFHCNAHLVPKTEGAVVINALEVAQQGGSFATHGLTFKAIESMEHLQHNTHDPDQNAMYRFSVDGIDIAHMGDVGNPLSEAQMDFFRGADILLALAGGFPVVELAELKRIITETKPKLVIPMHFRTLCYKPRNMHWIGSFLNLFADQDVDFSFTSSATLTKEMLPETTRALVIDYL
jgi:L-ascorbate metabolism protein UlaG (beta-lactamase superfamily)